MNQGTKKTWRQILAILAGVLVAIAIIVPVSLLAVLLGISDGKGEHSREPIVVMIIVLGMITGSFMAGYITTLISELKKFWPAIVTGGILTALYLLNADDPEESFDRSEVLVLLMILPLSCLGCWWGLRKTKG